MRKELKRERVGDRRCALVELAKPYLAPERAEPGATVRPEGAIAPQTLDVMVTGHLRGAVPEGEYGRTGGAAVQRLHLHYVRAIQIKCRAVIAGVASSRELVWHAQLRPAAVAHLDAVAPSIVGTRLALRRHRSRRAAPPPLIDHIDHILTVWNHLH